MNALRKLIGVLLIGFIGLPLLFSMIWTVGLIKAVASPEFLTDLPRRIIAEIPAKADEIFRDAQSDAYVTDGRTRAWFQAAGKTGISPTELMEETGLLNWMSGELSGSLRQVGQMLKGKKRPRPVIIDLRPLKAAVLSPEVGKFLDETLKNLPPCDARDLRAWEDIAARGLGDRRLPACRPDFSEAREALAATQAKIAGDIDDKIEVFGGFNRAPAFPFGVYRTLRFSSFLLLLIPALFIFLGAVVADSTPSGFLKWSGVSILLGGIPALLLALVVKSSSLWALGGALHWHGRRMSELGDLVLDRMKGIPEQIIDQLFSPVVMAALFVCLAGVMFIVASNSVRDKSRRTRKPSPTSPESPRGQATAPPVQGPAAPDPGIRVHDPSGEDAQQ